MKRLDITPNSQATLFKRMPRCHQDFLKNKLITEFLRTPNSSYVVQFLNSSNLLDITGNAL